VQEAVVADFGEAIGQDMLIDAEIPRRGLQNVAIVTADLNTFDTTWRFDRVVSVEMFEHMRNYAKLLERVSSWTKPGGLLFVHLFSHWRFAYPFEVKDSTDWMAQRFFTGGLMPSNDLLLYFQDHFCVREHWFWNGVHYQKTAEAWLGNLDRHWAEALALLARIHGEGDAVKRLVGWRAFFMACAELWGYRSGNEWGITHFLFENGRI
jgi:cyclopropane-fatty-acyl-phospholipid synthase